MKLIFTSYGFKSPIIRNKLRKVITDAKTSRILILPFAGFNSALAGLKEKEAVIEYGFCEENIYVADENNLSDIKCKTFDYIYVSEGDTFKLLKSLKELDSINLISDAVKNGAVYIGVSAGAYVACDSIEYVGQLEDNDYIDNDYSAIGLCDKIIICHYDLYGYSYYRSCADKFPDYEIMTIDNDEAVIIDGDSENRI